jgi:hypothetical protein
MKLVQSNDEADTIETTKSAFQSYQPTPEGVETALTILTRLKGIGPATASLILACYDPEKVPFFSDELFRYLHWEGSRGKGWDRKLQYSLKEYKSLVEKANVVLKRLGKDISAVEMEKAAYVLGKREAALTRSGPPKAAGADESREKAMRKRTVPDGVERVSDTSSRAAVSRKSKRQKASS